MLLLTWEYEVCHDSILPFLCVAHKRHVNVHYHEGHRCQERNDPDAHSIVTRRVILVEDALGLGTVDSVDVSLCCDASEHHQGKYLHWNRGKKMVPFNELQQHKKTHTARLSGLPINFTLHTLHYCRVRPLLSFRQSLVSVHESTKIAINPVVAIHFYCCLMKNPLRAGTIWKTLPLWCIRRNSDIRYLSLLPKKAQQPEALLSQRRRRR